MSKDDVFESDSANFNTSVETADVSWFETADAIAEATYKVTGIWQDPQEDFWHDNSTLMKHLSKEVASRIMDEAEAIRERQLHIRKSEVEKTTRLSIGRSIVKCLRILDEPL